MKKCFRCGSDKHISLRSLREPKRPELCSNCLNYIYNFKPLPVLSVNKKI